MFRSFKGGWPFPQVGDFLSIYFGSIVQRKTIDSSVCICFLCFVKFTQNLLLEKPKYNSKEHESQKQVL